MREKLMERFLSGGTNCPRCGTSVCSSASRLLMQRHFHCPACGAPCTTPLWVYIAALAVAIVGGGLYIRATIGPGWQRDGRWIFSCVCAGLLAYAGAGNLLLGLVPLRYREGQSWGPVAAPLEHFFSYAAEDVYHAANNALRRAAPYEVTERDMEQRILWASKSSNALTRNRLQELEPALYLSLLTEELESGGCRMALNILPKLGGMERFQQERELERIVQLVQAELEHFQDPKASQKIRT